MAAMRPMFSGTLLFMVLSACHLLLCTGDSSAEALAQSDFIWDDEDWVVGGEGSVDMTIAHGSRLVKSSDDGKKVWYFAAPTKFLGEKRAAYGGQLKYRLGFFEYDSAGGDLQADYDVVLASEKFGLRIGIKNVVEPWTFNKHYSVLLSESAPWVTLPGGVQRPSKPEFQRCVQFAQTQSPCPSSDVTLPFFQAARFPERSVDPRWLLPGPRRHVHW